MNGVDFVASLVKSKLSQAPKDGNVQCADVDNDDDDKDNENDDDDDNNILLAQELETVD